MTPKFAKKSLGQNFLRDQAVIDRIIQELGPIGDKTVVEIGPGRGALTEKLLPLAQEIYAIEFDRDMVAVLRDRFSDRPNFNLIKADALTFDYSSIAAGEGNLKLVANLPYNVSTPILQKLGDQRHLFSSLVLMFQREVVERMTAKPRKKDRGFLSVIVENAFSTEHLFDVPPTAFVPVPKVWSSVVRLTPKVKTDVDEKLFRRLISAGFEQKRKTLANNLKAVLDNTASTLNAAGIDGRRRAETLTLDEWRELTTVILSEEITKAGL